MTESRKKQIIQLAEVELNAVNRQIPVPVLDIAKNKRIDVKEYGFQDNESISGVLLQIDDGSWGILINENHTPKRQRFTIAHEIGHFLLHEKPVIDNDIRAYYRAPLDESTNPEWEQEANLFAANLLMPEREVKDIYEEYESIEDTARFFGVSISAMAYRLENIWVKSSTAYV